MADVTIFSEFAQGSQIFLNYESSIGLGIQIKSRGWIDKIMNIGHVMKVVYWSRAKPSV